MIKLDFSDMDGVWRTVGGRRIFIRTGQSLSDAMKKSGKFKGLTKKGMETVAKNGPEFRKAGEELKELIKEAKNKEKEIDEKNSKESKTNFDSIKKEYDDTLKKVVEYNTEREKIYENAGSDEAYKNLHGKESEKNAKNSLSSSEYKKFEELTNKYNEGRKELARIDDKMEEYKKSNPEEYKKAHEKYKETERIKRENDEYDGWRMLEKQQQMSKEQNRDVSFEEAVKEIRKDIKEKNERNKAYQEYVNDTLNNDEYLKANRPNEYWQKKMKESGVKTFADEIKEQNKVETISKAEYDKMPNDYKGTLKELVETAKFRGENKQDLIKQYEKMGFDIDKDKTILKRTERGTTLIPVKINDDKQENNNQITNTLRRKAYQKYLKEHPASKITFEDFKDMNKMK